MLKKIFGLKSKKLLEAVEDFIMRRRIAWTLHKILLG
jgi:hypothetical protein